MMLGIKESSPKLCLTAMRCVDIISWRDFMKLKMPIISAHFYVSTSALRSTFE